VSAAGSALISRHRLKSLNHLSADPSGTFHGGCAGGYLGPAAVTTSWTEPMTWSLVRVPPCC